MPCIRAGECKHVQFCRSAPRTCHIRAGDEGDTVCGGGLHPQVRGAVVLVEVRLVGEHQGGCAAVSHLAELNTVQVPLQRGWVCVGGSALTRLSFGKGWVSRAEHMR
jgi:hypothetical protein